MLATVLYSFYDFHNITIIFISNCLIFLNVIPVANLPTDHVDDQLLAVRAVTSESGQGAIIQYNQELYELNCEISGFSWRILPQKLSPGVIGAVMMTLPIDYTC